MDRPVVSVISTVYNEGASIEEFLNSLLDQSFLPDEIIIIDGGSNDETFDILREYQQKYPTLLKVYQLKGANIARGRNYAISKAKGLIIVTVDAGCIYSKDYIRIMIIPLLKYLIKNSDRFGLKKEDVIAYVKSKGLDLSELEVSEEAEFVQGRYYAYYKTDFEYFAGLMLVKKNQCKIPTRASARATAYFKYVWEKVGRYPEDFITGEDTLFNYKVLEAGFKWICVDSRVYWKMPRNLKEFYKKFERYAIGDVIQGNIFRNKKLAIFSFGFWSYVWLLAIFSLLNIEIIYLLVSLAVLYLFIFSIYIFSSTKNYKALIYVPLLESVRRVAYNVGIIKGLLRIVKMKFK